MEDDIQNISYEFANDGLEKRLGNKTDLHVGHRVREKRLELGLNQKQFAGLINVTYQQVHKYERGENRISVGKLFDIATALETPVSWFFEGLNPARISEAAAEECSGANTTMHPVKTRQRLMLNRLFDQVQEAQRPKLLEIIRLVAGAEQQIT